MRDRARSLVTSMLLLSACASVPPAHVDPARDPANPRAGEAPLVVGGRLPTNDSTLTVGKPPFETGESGTKEGVPHDHASQEMHEQETVYACPMHPEVRSKSQGKCPKCGMTLVPEQKR
jgi:Heavy metal binding domain